MGVAAMLRCLCYAVAFAASENETKLQFNEDGTFKILYFYDMQDDSIQNQFVKDYAKTLLPAKILI